MYIMCVIKTLNPLKHLKNDLILLNTIIYFKFQLTLKLYCCAPGSLMGMTFISDGRNVVSILLEIIISFKIECNTWITVQLAGRREVRTVAEVLHYYLSSIQYSWKYSVEYPVFMNIFLTNHLNDTEQVSPSHARSLATRT
jgi:hypothetical protein